MQNDPQRQREPKKEAYKPSLTRNGLFGGLNGRKRVSGGHKTSGSPQPHLPQPTQPPHRNKWVLVRSGEPIKDVLPQGGT